MYLVLDPRDAIAEQSESNNVIRYAKRMEVDQDCDAPPRNDTFGNFEDNETGSCRGACRGPSLARDRLRRRVRRLACEVRRLANERRGATSAAG